MSTNPTSTPAAPFRQEHYPFTSRYFQRGGLAQHYLDEGQGEAVVMLHGNPTWSFYYRKLVLGLRGQCRVVVPDHMGCGLSDQPDDRDYAFTLAQRVEDLEALLEHLRLPARFTLVLHDWGGMIGMAYAARHPERIARLVLLNTAAFHLPATKKLPPSLWLCRHTPLDALLIQRTGLFVRLVARWGCRRRALSALERGAYLAPQGLRTQRLAQLRFVQDIPLRADHPSYALVSEVQAKLSQFRDTPALICWGEQDWVFDEHFLREWQRQWPQARVHRFPDAGHLVLEDAPDEILALVRQFLVEHPNPA